MVVQSYLTTGARQDLLLSRTVIGPHVGPEPTRVPLRGPFRLRLASACHPRVGRRNHGPGRIP